MTKKGWLCFTCCIFLILLDHLVASFAQKPSSAAARPPARRIDFTSQIQPIFRASCYKCHGPENQRGQLRLDSRSVVFQRGLIIPGNSKDSRLLHRVLGLGDQARMPMGGPPLTRRQIALIRAWIDQGAPWPDESIARGAKTRTHWAYIKPARPPLPAVKNRSWIRNPIDNFILARLEKEKLSPSPEAPKEALVRRLYLDLIGLPPSVKEVDAFLADNSSDAYEKLVDHLLASPHYGERWARPWLDLARYADTHGYEKDNRRSMWKYRDWVINALNKDMPFDQFTIEQIAGDMLPNATIDQKIATGFHRNTMFNEEGGVDKEEARWETIVDRVDTTATVWLGSTLACAQCHNHKYDPFTQKDFYRLFAFFEPAEEPKLEMPTPEQETRRKAIEAEITGLENLLKTQTPELEAAQLQWEHRIIAAQADWTALDPVEYTSSGGATLTKLADGSLLATGANPEKDIYTIVAKTDLKEITGVRLEAIVDPRLPHGGPGRDPYGSFTLTGFEAAIAPAGNSAQVQPLSLIDAVADDSQKGFEAKNLITGERKGWAIDANRDASRVGRQAVFVVDKAAGFDSGTVLVIKLKHEAGYMGQGIGRFRLSVTAAADPTSIVNISAQMRPILSIPVAERTEKQKNDLAAYYRSIAPVLKPARERVAELRKQLKDLEIVSTLIMQERPSFQRPYTYLRLRGSFLNKGEKVYAGVPEFLHPLPESQLPNRLGLAHWLVDKDNPLVARVTVNRIWEQYFGRGIVETSEDFGAQGERPTHPELLDWLATEFMRQGWSMKAMHRLIVTSATYRQSSTVTPDLLERDPYNRLLARGPRFRMEAEMIRDVALAASGLLSRKIGGPSVFPYQPEGIWDIPYNDDKWRMSEGEDRYRRGIYTFLRRTSPYPSLMMFDATSREFCTVRRVRTNTPLQALVTLNDPAFFDAARGLAKRILAEAASEAEARAVYGFRLCVSRQPRAEELEQIITLYKQQLEWFRRDERAAQQIVKGDVAPPAEIDRAELAAWIVVSNMLLNLDETLTKE